jgi:hypothetical protein
MRIAIGLTAVLLSAATALTAQAAAKAPQKGPPACAAISFRPLPAGMSDGEQTAGLYKSRFGSLELHAEVKGGEPADYFVVANGKRLAAAPAAVPEAVAACAAAKKLPKPGPAATPCAGQRFRVVIAHAGKDRVAALYGLDGGNWRFCSLGSF